MFNLNIPKGRYPGESPGGWVVIEHMIYISALIPRRIDARIAGWSSGLACQADNLKVGGSNPSPATDTGRKCAIKFDARRSKETTARVPVLAKPGTQRSESYRPCLQKYEKQIK